MESYAVIIIVLISWCIYYSNCSEV